MFQLEGGDENINESNVFQLMISGWAVESLPKMASQVMCFQKSLGSYCARLRERFPDLSIRFVNGDFIGKTMNGMLMCNYPSLTKNILTIISPPLGM